MYDLPQYKENDEQKIDEFIARYPLAYLSGCDAENRPIATQIPLFLEELNGRKVFRGHIMKNTDHHRAFLHNPQVLIVFSGPNTYVSGTWYSQPYTPSTWNYMSVYIKGLIHFIDDAQLIEILRSTTLHFENNNYHSTTIYDNLPTEYTQKLMQAIAGFEIEILKLDTVFKLSQNRDEQSYDHIITQLKQKDENAQRIAAAMEQRRKNLFGGEK